MKPSSVAPDGNPLLRDRTIAAKSAQVKGLAPLRAGSVSKAKVWHVGCFVSGTAANDQELSMRKVMTILA
ncbi:MAG: hypothetical protein KF754_15315, partial [Planctomycetes bacterium]|nr:hypothetical protein [Planctomycetota bacterium]